MEKLILKPLMVVLMFFLCLTAVTQCEPVRSPAPAATK